MFKMIFVLVLNSYNSVNTDLKFETLQECELAKSKIQTTKSGYNTCIEMKVPIEKKKKIKCTITNSYDYVNHIDGSRNSHNLDGYPYPTSFSCVEE